MTEHAPEPGTAGQPPADQPGTPPPGYNPPQVPQTPQEQAPAAPVETSEPVAQPADEDAVAPSSAGVGSFVAWEVGEDGSDAVSTFYGVVVEDDVELGLVDGEEAHGIRVAVLHDLRVISADQLKAL